MHLRTHMCYISCVSMYMNNICHLRVLQHLLILYKKMTLSCRFEFLLLLLILPCHKVISHVPILEKHENPAMQAMIDQACMNIKNQTSCLSSVRSKIPHIKHQNRNSILKAALETTLDDARLAIETVTKFHTLSVSSREQIAIEDCKELLDFSVSELSWSLLEMKDIRAGSRNMHYEGNMKAWLSAALSNQDTCLEGFEGTDRHLVSFIKGSLTQVTQLISNVLGLYVQLHSTPFRPPRNITSYNNVDMDFPKWITDGDKELVLSGQNGMHVDFVVAADGTGHYRSISQAIYEAPSYSNRRFVIYVKRGIYKENIDMKKKKTNIMLVGDGIGATIVTGNRNFMQGWTTFRTATVGWYPLTFFFFLPNIHSFLIINQCLSCNKLIINS